MHSQQVCYDTKLSGAADAAERRDVIQRDLGEVALHQGNVGPYEHNEAQQNKVQGFAFGSS